MSLAERHAQLVKEGWKPSPREEVPLAQKRQRMGKRVLTDEQVMYARKTIVQHGYKELAEMFGVSRHTVYAAVKGISYRHLNWLVKPQR